MFDTILDTLTVDAPEYAVYPYATWRGDLYLVRWCVPAS